MIKNKVRVKIINLGRGNFTGSFTFTGSDEEINNQLETECRKHLISQNISCDGKTIFAGFHKVGEIEVLQNGNDK